VPSKFSFKYLYFSFSDWTWGKIQTFENHNRLQIESHFLKLEDFYGALSKKHLKSKSLIKIWNLTPTIHLYLNWQNWIASAIWDETNRRSSIIRRLSCVLPSKIRRRALWQKDSAAHGGFTIACSKQSRTQLKRRTKNAQRHFRTTFLSR
jgi:hypothetical protein